VNAQYGSKKIVIEARHTMTTNENKVRIFDEGIDLGVWLVREIPVEGWYTLACAAYASPMGKAQGRMEGGGIARVMVVKG
jgi:hypothetical protein